MQINILVLVIIAVSSFSCFAKEKWYSYPAEQVVFFADGKRFPLSKPESILFTFIGGDMGDIDTSKFRIQFKLTKVSKLDDVQSHFVEDFGGKYTESVDKKTGTIELPYTSLKNEVHDQYSSCGMFYDEEESTQIDLDFKSKDSSKHRDSLKFMFDFDISLTEQIKEMYDDMHSLCKDLPTSSFLRK